MLAVIVRSSLRQAPAWILLFASLAASILFLAPSNPTGVPSESGYDHERALATLDRIAAEPHPVTSAAEAEVRAYLVEELEKLGVDIELQEGRFAATDLTNILVLMPGSASTGTVLVMAHYDTVHGSPGAGDDSSGVVALLETVRVLAGESLRNDLVVLLTDGEERGLLGARLFARDHPLLAEIDVVINFEAIGNAGPLFMFETGPGSGGLVSLLGETAPNPFGNSLAAVIYGAMPNDTDLSVFRDLGVRGLNFAVAGASGYYHSPQDTAAAFSPGSLAHMGDTAVRMATRLAKIDLHSIERDERAFLAAPPFGFLVWRSRLHVWIAVALLLALLVAIVRRRVIGPSGFFRGLLCALLLALLGGGGALALGTAGSRLAAPTLPLSYDAVYGLLLALALGAALTVQVACSLWIRGPRAEPRARELIVGAWALWTLLSVAFFAVDLTHIGASYPFAASSACLSLATALRLFRDAPPWLVALPLVPAIYLLGPVLGPLVQLSSQSATTAVWFGSVLLGLGVLLCPAFCARRGPETWGIEVLD